MVFFLSLLLILKWEEMQAHAAEEFCGPLVIYTPDISLQYSNGMVETVDPLVVKCVSRGFYPQEKISHIRPEYPTPELSLIVYVQHLLKTIPSYRQELEKFKDFTEVRVIEDYFKISTRIPPTQSTTCCNTGELGIAIYLPPHDQNQFAQLYEKFGDNCKENTEKILKEACQRIAFFPEKLQDYIVKIVLKRQELYGHLLDNKEIYQRYKAFGNMEFTGE